MKYVFAFVVVLLLGAGFWMYASRSTSLPTPVITPQPVGSSTAKTLSVPEIGVTLPLPDSIQDLAYVAKSDPTLGTIAAFTTASLAGEGGSRCTVENAPLGIAYATTSPEVLPAQGMQIASSSGKYLYYIHPQEPCSEVSAIQKMQSAQIESLQASLKTAL